MITSLLAVAGLASLQSAPAAPDADTSGAPHVRAHHAMAYHPGTRRVLVTGGSTPRGSDDCCLFFDDTWQFDGTRWQFVSRSDRQLSGMRLAWDSRRGRMLSFGGFSGSQSIGDLRVLEEGRWRTLEVLAEMPAAEPGFVYDARRDRLVAFGGSGDGTTHGETWEHDGHRWTRWQGASPPARQGHVMVYDARRGVTIVFGGAGAAPRGQPLPRFNDLWEFDGTAWREVAFEGGPGGRLAAGATWDAARGVMVLFGGIDSTGMRGDLWSWDGTAWRRLAESGPPPRAMGALVHDSERNRLVLFGGRRGWPDDLGDTWEWDGAAWRQVVP